MTSPSDRPHAPISPSSLQNRSKCHHWTPEKEVADYVRAAAEKGERLHDAIRPAAKLDGLPDGDRKAVAWCRGVIQSETDDTWTMQFEGKVSVPGNQWGYVDCIAASSHKHVVKIFDFKMGREPVAAASENLQLQAYAVGVADAIPSATVVETHILQPWRENAPDHHDKAVYNRTDIETLRSRCAVVVENAKNPTLYRTGAHCLRCESRSVCPELGATAANIAENYQDRIGELTREDFHASLVEDPRKAGLLLDLATVMAKWADSVKYHMTQLANEKEIVPEGWAMAHRKGATKTKHPDVIWSTVNSQYGVDTAKFLSTVDVNYSRLKQVVRDCIPHGKKQDVETALELLLSDTGCVIKMDEVTYLRKKPTNKEQKQIEA